MFTQYLYVKDEVLLSLITGLLKRRDLNECLFWTNEYYSSGFNNELWDFIWKIYYDFYYLLNKNFKYILNKRYKKWKKEPNIYIVLTIIYNLFSLNHSPEVFLYRHVKISNIPKSVKLPKKLVKIFPTRNIFKDQFIMTIHTKNYKKLYQCLLYKIDYVTIFKTYMEKVFQKKIKFGKIEKIIYNNKTHFILAEIIYFLKNEYNSYNLKTFIYNILKSSIIEKFKTFNNEKIKNIYTTLLHKKLYSIDNSIGGFLLERDNKKLNELYWYKWEYYSFDTPVWKERFQKYGAEKNEEKEDILFPSDEKLENFYEEWGYEPDEQNKENQQKTLLNIEKCNIKTWIDKIYPDNNIKIKLKQKRISYL